MKAKYALRALCALADAGDGRVQARQLAATASVPAKFLEVILVELRKAGMVDSKRGVQGGHALAKPAAEIRVGDVIRLLDGPLAPIRCASVTAYQPCTDCPDPDACALRDLMGSVRDAMSAVLDRRSLAQLALQTRNLQHHSPIGRMRAGPCRRPRARA